MERDLGFRGGSAEPEHRRAPRRFLRGLRQQSLCALCLLRVLVFDFVPLYLCVSVVNYGVLVVVAVMQR